MRICLIWLANVIDSIRWLTHFCLIVRTTDVPTVADDSRMHSESGCGIVIAVRMIAVRRSPKKKAIDLFSLTVSFL